MIDQDELGMLLQLAVGSHDKGTGKACAMNIVSWEQGDATITDFPKCSDRVLASLVQNLNDLAGAGPENLIPAPLSFQVLDLGHLTIGTAPEVTNEKEYRSLRDSYAQLYLVLNRTIAKQAAGWGSFFEMQDLEDLQALTGHWRNQNLRFWCSQPADVQYAFAQALHKSSESAFPLTKFMQQPAATVPGLKVTWEQSQDALTLAAASSFYTEVSAWYSIRTMVQYLHEKPRLAFVERHLLPILRTAIQDFRAHRKLPFNYQPDTQTVLTAVSSAMQVGPTSPSVLVEMS